MPNNSKSIVWEFFIKDNTKGKVKCKLCEKLLSRGGQNERSSNTSNMTKYMKSKHPVEFRDKLEEQEEELRHEKEKSRKQSLSSYLSEPATKKLKQSASEGASSSLCTNMGK